MGQKKLSVDHLLSLLRYIPDETSGDKKEQTFDIKSDDDELIPVQNCLDSDDDDDDAQKPLNTFPENSISNISFNISYN